MSARAELVLLGVLAGASSSMAYAAEEVSSPAPFHVHARGGYALATWERSGASTESSRITVGGGTTLFFGALRFSGDLGFAISELYGRQRDYDRVEGVLLFPGEGAEELSFAIPISNGIAIELAAALSIPLIPAVALEPFADASIIFGLPSSTEVAGRELGAGAGIGIRVAPGSFVSAFAGVRLGYRRLAFSVPDADAMSFAVDAPAIGARVSIEFLPAGGRGFHVALEAGAIDETSIYLRPGWSF